MTMNENEKPKKQKISWRGISGAVLALMSIYYQLTARGPRGPATRLVDLTALVLGAALCWLEVRHQRRLEKSEQIPPDTSTRG